MKVFKVHIGYTRNGRNRWRKFPTFTAASSFCEAARKATGIILTIVTTDGFVVGDEPFPGWRDAEAA